jgi:hypothetical protein
MRYFIITYLRKSNGQIDEQTEITKNLRRKDIQCANVILDFRDRQIVKAWANGQPMVRNWDYVVTYFMQYYQHIFKRLANENGYEIELESSTEDPQPSDTSPDLVESHNQ